MDVFGEDYLYFMQDVLAPDASERETELIWTLLGLAPGDEVLDAPCGDGRIANRLAARGAQVTALDATPRFLELARRDASAAGVAVDYVEGDIRSLPWRGRFDAVLNWFTSFGYFEDDENREVLAQAHAALKPGGHFLLELNNLLGLMPRFQPVSLAERDGNLMIDVRHYDVPTGRMETNRIVVRDGAVRRTPFFVRMTTFVELRDWLCAAGFERVDGYDENGEELTATSRRMIVVARKAS